MRAVARLLPVGGGLLLALALVFLAAAAPLADRAGAADLYAPKCGGGKVLLTADEKGVFTRQNDLRRSHGLRALCIHPALQEAARFHSREEIQHDYTDHDSFDGTVFYETSRQRLSRFGYGSAGYRRYAVGENIYSGSAGRATPQDAVGWWMNSSAHRANILGKTFRQVGIGAVTGEYRGLDGYTAYTVDFGMRRR